MLYKEFGKTGIKVSSLGFGAMRLPMGVMKNIAVTKSNRKIPNFILELELRCI